MIQGWRSVPVSLHSIQHSIKASILGCSNNNLTQCINKASIHDSRTHNKASTHRGNTSNHSIHRCSIHKAMIHEGSLNTKTRHITDHQQREKSHNPPSHPWEPLRFLLA
jgi:hypothetical protein